MGNCGYTGESGAQRIDEGNADLICFGRLYIANPDLALRFKEGLEVNTDLDYVHWFAGGEKGYTDYPTAAAAPASLDKLTEGLSVK